MSGDIKPHSIWEFGYGLYEDRKLIWQVMNSGKSLLPDYLMDQEFILRKNQQYTLKAFRDGKIFDSIIFRFRFAKHIIIKDLAEFLIENTYTEGL